MREEKDFRNYYDIIKKLGEGAFGIVYEAKLKTTKELRAIKVIDKQKIIDSLTNQNLTKPSNDELRIYINGFFNEIENMKLLEGKNKENINTVKFFEYFHTKNEFSIVMELCDGNLFEMLSNKESNKGFSKEEIYDILVQLNNTFKIMFDNKLVHRDLKLQNILFKYIDKGSNKYIVKLSDYGISKHLLSFTKRMTTQIGTLNLMAPEILNGENYNEKCDLWSIGIMIYMLFFHKYPYNGNTERAVLNQINNLKQNIIMKTNDSNLDDLILRLLEINPNKRISWGEYFSHNFFQKNIIENKTINNFEKIDKEYNLNKIKNIHSIKEGFYSPPIGLKNTDSINYMNSVIQCFCHIEKFVNFFKYNNQIINLVRHDKINYPLLLNY